MVVYRGFTQKVSANIGADLAVLFMYSLSAVLLFALFRIPNLKIIPRKYLFGATALFVVYEICFSYAIALAQNAQQAIEISLVNYLWPSMTILMLILFKELNFNKWVILGLGISLAGVFYIQTGNGTIDLAAVISHMQSNPLSYGLAFVGASLWSLYCVMTKNTVRDITRLASFYCHQSSAVAQNARTTS